MDSESTLQAKYYLVAFLTKESGGDWQLNLSSVGTWTPGSGWSNNTVEASLKESFMKLQEQGGSVLVSFGGADFEPGSSVSAANIDALAQAVAYSFLGGDQAPPSTSPFANWKPAFSDGWHFDGIDLDLEESVGPAYVPNSIWVTFAESIKKYAPNSLLTCAPQSPYLYNTAVQSPFGVPFPQGADDTCGHVSQPESGDFLWSTTYVGLFDSLLVQFYNQGATDEFPTEKNFNARFCQLVTLVSSSTSNGKNPQIYVGVAAKGYGVNGDPEDPVYDPVAIGQAIKSAAEAAGGSVSSWWFGGVMGWLSAPVTTFVQEIVEAVGGGTAALYGYQAGDPDWS